MRRYETITILDPDIPAEVRDPLLDRCREIVDQHGGMTVEVDDWGIRKLAYEIKKKPRGYYVRLDYCGDGDLVQELERFFRIDDRVMKYLTVLLDKEVDAEQIKEEIAGEETEKAALEQPAAETAEPAVETGKAAETDSVTTETKEEE